ncbi:MAG: hypothetical protein SGBAC_006577 [Bacillariaceae sp.]
MILVMNRSTHDHHDDMQESIETQPTADEKAEKAPIEKEFLQYGFQPGKWDVICHNGKDPKSHATIRSKSTQNGGFVRYDDAKKRWYEVGDKVARDKVGHSLREAMRALDPEAATELSSSGKAQAVTSATGFASMDASSLPMMPMMMMPKGTSASLTSPATPDNKRPDQAGSSGSSNMESISDDAGNEEATPLAKNLVDWFESDSMDESQ